MIAIVCHGVFAVSAIVSAGVLVWGVGRAAAFFATVLEGEGE